MKRVIEKDRRDYKKQFRLNARECKLIEKNAKLFAGGDISLWLRFSGIHYKPKSRDLAITR